jgi:hypothetical protein
MASEGEAKELFHDVVSSLETPRKVHEGEANPRDNPTEDGQFAGGSLKLSLVHVGNDAAPQWM